MNIRKSGQYETLGSLQFFIPYPLPPAHPPLQLSAATQELYQQALENIERLNTASNETPDQHRFIKSYTIKEALLSSAIEGIHTTLIDVFHHESFKTDKNTELVLNYVAACTAAIDMMQQENLPISSRIIRAAHKILLGNQEHADPGHYRKQMVKVGNLVPAPAQKIPDLMSDLEKFINEYDELPVLIKAGLAHLQFETIHPFLDGNGRIGRLLIILILMDGKVLHNPILYPSYYFKKQQLAYYTALDRVRTHGDFEGWIQYYLQAISQSAQDAHIRTLNIEKLELQLKVQLQTDAYFARYQDLINSIISSLFAHPIISIMQLSQDIGKSYNTTQKIMMELVRLQIVTEKVPALGQRNQRSKFYQFDAYLILLEKEL